MLETLEIRNLALIKTLDVDFSEGLNILSGETGAGKSLIISAIKLLLGKRAEKRLIRSGEEVVEITALFRFSSPQLLVAISTILDASGITMMEDGQLIIRRLISENKSKNYINSTLSPLKVLDALGDILLDVYAPGENFKLMRNTYQRQLLDNFGNHKQLMKRVHCSYDLWQKKLIEKEQIFANILDKGEADILQYQLKEIEELDINLNDDKNLTQTYNQVANAQDLMNICQKSIYSLNEGEDSLVQHIHKFSRSLFELSSMDKDFYATNLNSIESILEHINELSDSFEVYKKQLSLDPEKLEYLSDRLAKISSLQKKFGPRLEDILQYQDKIKIQIALVLNYDSELLRLDEDIASLEKEYRKNANDLSKQRKITAKNLAKNIEKELSQLEFTNILFEIVISQQSFSSLGQDLVNFFISPNIGEELAPLSKIASSGEISRIMLAIKSATTSMDNTPILIFDEIDANIGGITGLKIAQKINSLAKSKQIFSITHLAQVAAAGQNHYFVSKEINSGRTFCQINLLNDECRINEVTRMLGDVDKTPETTKYADKLINSFNN